jgi:hypothetical protein
VPSLAAIGDVIERHMIEIGTTVEDPASRNQRSEGRRWQSLISDQRSPRPVWRNARNAARRR